MYFLYCSDCWAPGFFLIWILRSFSAMLIMVSGASARSFSHSNCFSSAAIFCCNASVDCSCSEVNFFFELFMLLVEYFSCFSVGGKLCIPWYIATHLQMVVRLM